MSRVSNLKSMFKKTLLRHLVFYSSIFQNLSYSVFFPSYFTFFQLSKGSNLSFTRLHTLSSLRSSIFGCSVAPKLPMSEQSPYILFRSVQNLGNLAALMRFSSQVRLPLLFTHALLLRRPCSGRRRALIVVHCAARQICLCSFFFI